MGIAPLVVRHNGRGVMPSFDARVLVVEDNAVNQVAIVLKTWIVRS